MVDVVVDVSTLSRSAKGSVTGLIFLRGPTGEFPDKSWSDFPVVILGWWIEGLSRLAAGQERSFQGMFMDGPYAFVVQRGAGGSGRIAWGRTGEETWLGIVGLRALLQSFVVAGRQVSEACRARGWASRDLETLEAAVSRSAV